MASLKYVVVFSLLMMMLAHHYAKSMTVRTDKQAIERYTSNKRSVQGENEDASNRNGGIELTIDKQADKGYKQEYLEERGLSERSLEKITKRLYQYLRHYKLGIKKMGI